MNRGDGGTEFQPGDNVRWYAAQFGWNLARRSIFVEGDTDEKYLTLAARLFAAKTNHSLLNDELKVLSVGAGAQGGTDAIKENLVPLWKMIELDCDSSERPMFRAIVLLDGDHEGRKTCQYLTDRYIKLRENRDIFILKRLFPRESQDPKILTQLIKEANAAWHTIDCEIEDLLSRELLDVFLADNEGATRDPPTVVNDAYHFEFTAKGKADLARWVPGIATLKDVEGLVELLKSLRHYLGLRPDGD